MPLVFDIQAQAAFKAFVTQTSHTSPVRNWFQEPFIAKPILYGRDIRAVQPDFASTQAQADAYALANPSLVEKVSLKRMTVVPGTNNNAFGLYDTFGDPNSELLGSWVSPFDGSGLGYFPRFFRDAAGTDEITTAFGPTNWFFHAFSGLLVWGGETASDNWVTAGVTEVYATVYRYIGPSISDTITGGSSLSAITFNQDKRVPSNGTLFLKAGEVATSAVPWVLATDATLAAISFAVDKVETNDYTVEVLVNGSVAAGAVLTAGNTKVVSATAVALSANDELSLRLVRTSGSGRSVFRNTLVNIQLISS
jgi:hypothetical protein